jgi:hypothetical protein
MMEAILQTLTALRKRGPIPADPNLAGLAKYYPEGLPPSLGDMEIEGDYEEY